MGRLVIILASHLALLAFIIAIDLLSFTLAPQPRIMIQNYGLLDIIIEMLPWYAICNYNMAVGIFRYIS